MQQAGARESLLHFEIEKYKERMKREGEDCIVLRIYWNGQCDSSDPE